MLVVLLLALAKCDLGAIANKNRLEAEIVDTLAKIDDAMVDFVAQNRRLPCPADGRVLSNTANAGREDVAACGTQQYGVVPWVTLGLNEQKALDPWKARISYRVDPALAGTAIRLMNMSNCDVSGTGSVGAGGICRTPNPPCATRRNTCTRPSTFLAGKGLNVWNGVGGAAGWAARSNNRAGGTGAAYILISHGKTGALAYNSGGVFQPGSIGPIAIIPTPPPPALPTQTAGNDEIPNGNNRVLSLAASQAATFRDAIYDTSRTQSNFDDFVSHPTISVVLGRASLRERIH